MLLILKVPVVTLNITYVKGGSLHSLNVICNYILMGKAVIVFCGHENKQNKSIFHGNHISYSNHPYGNIREFLAQYIKIYLHSICPVGSGSGQVVGSSKCGNKPLGSIK